MIIPISTLERMQSDILGKLLSEGLLDRINIKSLRKMRIDSEIDLSLVYLTPRDGVRCGAGVIVGMPTLDVQHPDTPGPLLTVSLPIRAYEQPTINLNPDSGTLQTAESIVLLIIRLLHQFRIEGLAALYSGQGVAKPCEAPEGVIGYEAQFKAELAQDTVPRVTIPDIEETDLVVTLTPFEDNVITWFTLDGTYPGSGNAGATNYVGPFPVPAGTVVRWAGYKVGFNGSDIGQATVNRGLLGTEAPIGKIITPEGGGITIE